jgi:hypothetical protein
MKKILSIVAITTLATSAHSYGYNYGYESSTNNEYLDNHSYSNNYETNNFSGLGLNAGQGSRIANRANELNKDSYSVDDFSGLGMTRGEAARAVRRMNGW